MYASVWNQLYQFGHYLFSFLLLMVIVPKLLLKRPTTSEMEDRTDRLISRYLRISFFYILLGYLLVLTNLFEVLAIAAILVLLILFDYLRKRAKATRSQAVTMLGLLFYETLDLGFRLKQMWPRLRDRWKQRWNAPENKQKLLPRLLLLVILLLAGYLRFYDAWHTAAPAMSDGYVTLAWMKYLEERILQHHDALFHDGIYPQGFHLTLALLHKFAAIDPLYILRYTGPLDGVLMTFGLYFATSRWTGNRYAGIIAAAVFGLGGYALMSDDWDRQAATNSQEFAMIFAYPSLYYLARYLQKGKREDLLTGGAGVTITGLVHTLLFAFVGMGMFVLLGVGLVLNPKEMKRLWQLIQVGVLSVIIALIPFGIGKLLGADVHSASESFLTSKVAAIVPPLRFWDYAALVGMGLTFLVFLISRKPLKERILPLAAVGIIGATFVLYEYGGAYTSYEVLSVRTSALWELTVPFAIGFGLHAVLLLLQKVPGQRYVQAAVCLGVVAFMYTQTQFAPIMPYKMEWESGVEQYLQIASIQRPKTWMMVTDHTEGYDEVLGNGYHMYVDKQSGSGTTDPTLMDYDPTLPALTRKGDSNRDTAIPNDVYIYMEKNVFEVAKNNSIYFKLAPLYAARINAQKELKQWIATYQKYHNNLSVFYQDQNICIYHIHIATDQNQTQQEIWGSSSS